jgi:hypothetical protein
MQNSGEEIVGCYLHYIRGCEFIQYNLHLPDVQGEVDVIGISMARRELFVCEVAVHLVTGLQYVKDIRPDNVARFLAKFAKNIDWANQYFPGYAYRFMLWSPIVRSRANSQYDQLTQIHDVRDSLRETHNVELDLIVNRRFAECLTELRKFASKQTKELKSPIMRLMQIEEALKRHAAL